MSATPEPEVRCPFCVRIEANEVEQFYGDRVARFEPLNPVTPGHMLFVPERHVEHVPGSSDDVGVAMRYAQRYGTQRGEQFNLITSSGPDATQTVAHVHVHYVPRRPGDGLPLPWTPQQAAVTPVVPQCAATPADETALHSALRELMLVGHADDPHDPICRAKGFIRAALATTPADPGFEVWQRLSRAAFQVDSTHHFHEGPDGRPVCACGFVGSARKRSQTEHITAAVLEAFDHD